jgi:hypothetical protein
VELELADQRELEARRQADSIFPANESLMERELRVKAAAIAARSVPTSSGLLRRICFPNGPPAPEVRVGYGSLSSPSPPPAGPTASVVDRQQGVEGNSGNRREPTLTGSVTFQPAPVGRSGPAVPQPLVTSVLTAPLIVRHQSQLGGQSGRSRAVTSPPRGNISSSSSCIHLHTGYVDLMADLCGSLGDSSIFDEILVASSRFIINSYSEVTNQH